MEGVHAGSRDPGDTGGWYRVRPSHNHPVTFQSTRMFSDSFNDRRTVSTGQSRVNVCRVSVCVRGGEGRRGTFNILCQTDLCAVIEELPVAICHLESLPVTDRKAHHLCCCSVTKSCPALHDPMDCSTPGFVPHHLPEFAQVHIQ